MSDQFNPQFQSPQPYVPMAKRKSNWILPTILIIVILFLISLPFIIIGSLFSGFSSEFEDKPVEITDNSVMTITLDSFTEAPEKDPFAVFSGNLSRNTMFSVVKSIENAADDDRIKGIVLKEGMGNFGFGMAREISDALNKFKESGKFIYSYLSYAKENTYYLASISDSIFAPKMGFFEINGYGVSSLFLKGFFNKIGVDFYVEHFEDFKSAGEGFSRDKYSDSSRKQLKVLLQDRFNEFVAQVEKNRKIDRDKLLFAINQGQYSTDSLIAYKMIDGICTPSEFKDKVYFKIHKKMPIEKECKEDEEDEEGKNKCDKVNYVSVYDYVSDNDSKSDVYKNDVKIAYIEASGEITTTSSQGDAMAEGITDGRLIKDIEAAGRDKEVKAIILRINSPGGSALASDNIWQAIKKVRKNKPVYASMSDVAASGGYYIAMACDTIVAYPNTITGSIGVISMVPNASGMMQKLGITIDTLNIGDNSQFMNGAYPFSDKDKTKFRNLMQTIYFDFVTKAADSRKMSFDKMRSFAKGRVWSGEDALQNGLIDQLGNISTVFDIAKKRIGVPEGKKVLVDFYPKSEDSFEEFLEFIKNFRKISAKDISPLSKQIETFAFADKLFSIMPKTIQAQILYNLRLMEISKKESVLLTLPYYIN